MEQLAKDIFIETGYEGINVGAIITTTGVICIDTPTYARDARDWAARLHRLSPYPIQNIILTDADGDRILHTRWLNAPIITQQQAADRLRSYDKKYPQTIIDSLIQRNPARARELSNSTVEYAAMSFSDEITLYRSGHEITLISAPGPRPGNLWVALPRKGVLFTGDSVVVGAHPRLHHPLSGAWISNLEKLKTMRQYHTLVSGRGAMAQPEDIDRILQYLRAMRDSVSTLHARGDGRDELIRFVRDFIGRFPLGALPVEWVRQEIMTSMNNIFNELGDHPTPHVEPQANAAAG